MTTHSSHSRGFTMIEMAVTLAAIVVMTGLVVPAVGTIYQDYRIDQTVDDLQGLQNIVHHYYNSITSSTQNADGTWSYTYVTAANGNAPITMTAFNTQQGTAYPAVNPFGNDYMIYIADGDAFVQTTLPATDHDVSPATYVDNGNGTGTITLNNQRTNLNPLLPAAEVVKFSEYGEARR
ncbi:MAG: prepilin-type N-terminal cleavage/methylation domain-containing protein [Rhizobium sp.]|nr:MAG: prepilin-type N-terminal cleavage/methylation domain-containing protein [Rhizobium sp.]